jgi:transcription initiation factor IIE alpha subunit
MSYSSNFLAEKFVQTIARAFYTDTIVVVLDTLIREKYIREQELGPRLRMSQKQARDAIAALVDSDMLVKFEEVPLPEVDANANPNSKQTVKFYYIDYQSFVNLIRYRIYVIMKSIQSQERSEVDDIYYECPTCLTKYSSLQAMKQRSADFKFVCTNCCPDYDVSKTISQPSFRLRDVDNRGKLSDVQKLERKMKEQLSRSTDHDGILEMLEELKNVPLSRNKPSTNIRRGIRTSRVKDDDVATEINELITSKAPSKSTTDIKEKHFNLLSTRIDGTSKVVEAKPSASDVPVIVANLESKEDEVDIQAIKRMRQADMPVFLHESGVKGSSAIMQEVHELHLQRGTAAVSATASTTARTENTSDMEKSSILISRNTKISLAEPTKTMNDNEDDADEDDVQWEDED